MDCSTDGIIVRAKVFIALFILAQNLGVASAKLKSLLRSSVC